MSFGGHALDIILRQKLNQDQLKSTRRKQRNHHRKSLGKGSYYNSDTTVEELERIDRLLTEREKQQERYFIRMTFLIFSIALVLALAIWAFII
ncbi:MAG: hypothetical protein LUH22_06720 [Bacteroides sp.]|nr:hypothetical protein [Bacteroides sp.]